MSVRHAQTAFYFTKTRFGWNNIGTKDKEMKKKRIFVA
jgi:hypothetical protein